MEKIKVLDGGLSTELEKFGCNLTGDPLWSARILSTDPDLIVKVHKSYLESGAEIITTASYQASVQGFQEYLKITGGEARTLIQKSVKLAQQAKEEYLRENSWKKTPKDILIAGSVGPYGAYAADGSEYTGDYCDHMTQEELIAWHRPRVECLVECGVDVIAFETIPAVKEGEALMKLLQEFPSVKAWLSFSCQTLHETAHKEDISSAVNQCVKLAPAGQLLACGVNCCPPQYVETLLKDISTKTQGIPLIAYPNSGEKWESKTGWANERADPLSKYVSSWIDASARFIGGCCRTGPQDISEIALELSKHA